MVAKWPGDYVHAGNGWGLGAIVALFGGHYGPKPAPGWIEWCCIRPVVVAAFAMKLGTLPDSQGGLNLLVWH